MSTLAKLRQAVSLLDVPAEIEDDGAVWDEGTIVVQLDQSRKREFAHGATVVCASYYTSEKGSKAAAFASLIKDVERGTRPMSESTAHDCGVDL